MLCYIQRAKERGADVVHEIWEETDDSGTVRFATIKTYGETTHTFIEKADYKGLFLPGYVKPKMDDPILAKL